MQPLPRAQKIAAVLWMVLGVIVWNGIYDLMLMRGIKEVLFREALNAAGRGPRVSIAAVMDVTVFDATWIATVWASVITLAGLFTIKLLASEPRKS